MQTQSNHSNQFSSQIKLRRDGFTMVEILVAVAIMSLLLSIIFVPLRLGFETYHIGKVNSDLQQQGHVILQQIASDLRKSQFVYPNALIARVSDNSDPTSSCSTAPYKSGDTTNPNDWNYRPYIIADSLTATGTPFLTPTTLAYGACSTVSVGATKNQVRAWGNPARLDMLQMRRDANGATTTSKAGQDFIVSYYFRRLDIAKPYDAIDNPIQLFRAQIPYRNQVSGNPNSSFTVPNNAASETDLNTQNDWGKYPTNIGNCSAASDPNQTNRSFAWITHNYFGEADLEPLTKDAKNPKDMAGTLIPNAQTVPGAHTLVTPSDMGLYAPRADTLDASGNRVAEAFVPELSFTEEAVNGSRINRVTINLTLAKYDEAGAAAINGQGKSLKIRVSQTVDLPNTGCSN